MTSVNGTSITYRSTIALSISSSDFSQVGCQIGISKYFTRKGHTALSRIKNKKYLPPTEIRRITHRVYRMNARLSPQDWSRRAYPVFRGTSRGEKINLNRGAILRMLWNGAIISTQGGKCMRYESGENEIQNGYNVYK
jgi:hypothetical protein